jgi:DNA invertase Pin-like site-specific DNA recombinase
MSAKSIVASPYQSISKQHVAPAGIPRAAIYARVSTTNSGQSPEMQLRELREHAQRRGWEISCEYVDEGISGAKDRRPALDRMMADAHRRKFEVVLVWRFDRFARSVTHLLRALDTFRALGMEFVSLCEALDTATPAGRMTFTVLGAVAELERSLIAERVKAGIRNARSRGVRLGRPKVVADVPTIRRLRAQDRSWRSIGRELDIAAETAKKLLKSA